MIRQPPRSTRTDTLFPYTTLFRSIENRDPSCAACLKVYMVMTDRVGGDSPQLLAAPSQGRSVETIRSEEHTSELQSLMRISYAVFCLKKKNKHKITHQIKNYKIPNGQNNVIYQ